MHGQPSIAAVADGVVRVTWPLPLGIDHVHCYLLALPGGWMLVDTGLGSADGADAWRRVLEQVGGDVLAVVITHSHPDHVGGATDAATATGAPVFQSATDHAHCLRTWGDEQSPARFARYLARHGGPAAEVERIIDDSRRLRPLVGFVHDPRLLDEGDVLHGWRVVELPGHADGHVCLLRDGMLVAGDAILDPITPTVGRFAETAPDPLGRYQESLRRIERIAPRVAFTGHGRAIADPAARAREILTHHDERLRAAEAALDGGERSAWDVSLDLFPRRLPPAQRRFAVVETVAHLERLVLAGRLEQRDGDGAIRFCRRP
jgi:glyoxylase-like metal-dependent hydrolase (beta-lactamase superfamily II)